MASKFKQKYQKYKKKYRDATRQRGGIDPRSDRNAILNVAGGQRLDGTDRFVSFLKTNIRGCPVQGDNGELGYPQRRGANYAYYLGRPADQYPHFHPSGGPEDRAHPHFIFSPAAVAPRILIERGTSNQFEPHCPGHCSAGNGRGISPTTVNRIVVGIRGGGGQSIRIKLYLILLLIMIHDHPEFLRGIIDGLLDIDTPIDINGTDVSKREIFRYANFSDPCSRQPWTDNLERINDILLTIFRLFCEQNPGPRGSGYAALPDGTLNNIIVPPHPLNEQFNRLLRRLYNGIEGCLDIKWVQWLRGYSNDRRDLRGAPGRRNHRASWDLKGAKMRDLNQIGLERRTLRSNRGDCSSNHLNRLVGYQTPTNHPPPVRHVNACERDGELCREVFVPTGRPLTRRGKLNRDNYCNFRGWTRCNPNTNRCDEDLVDNTFINNKNAEWTATPGPPPDPVADQ